MSGEEVREKINQNNKIIHEALKKFILTNDIKILLEENEKLKKLCPHEFVKGHCKYCNKQENNNG